MMTRKMKQKSPYPIYCRHDDKIKKRFTFGRWEVGKVKFGG